MRVGLLMEGVQAHQQLAEASLEKLRAHTRGLDEVVRDEIRRTLIDELQELTTENRRAVQSLVALRRAANARGVFISMGVAALGAFMLCALVRWALPSASEIAALRTQRDALTQSVARLEQRGGRVEWRRCGPLARLCVRVERKAPTYGEQADYWVVKGY